MRKFTGVKRFLVLSTFLFLPFSANAAGPYDGVWELLVGVCDACGFVTINQNGNTLVAISLAVDADGYTQYAAAYTGTLEGTHVTITSVLSYHNVTVVADVEFTSATTAVITQTSCTPFILCEDGELPENVPFQAIKIF